MSAELRWPRPDAPGLETFRLPPDGRSLLIGRSPDVSLSLRHDPAVSREHVELSCTDGVWFIEDVGSTRGTRILRDGRLISVQRRERLRHGDRLQLGRTALTFHAPPSAGAEVDTLVFEEPTVELTLREREVLQELCADELAGRGGWPGNATLAAQLSLSMDGLRSHMKSLYRKFDLGDVPETQRRPMLIRRAVDRGYVIRREG